MVESEESEVEDAAPKCLHFDVLMSFQFLGLGRSHTNLHFSNINNRREAARLKV